MAAQLTIIPNCIPLVQYLANKTNDSDSAFSAGLTGLASAIRGYDPHKGALFISYAYTAIRRAIERGLTSEHQYLATRIKTVQQLFYQRTGNHLSPEQLSVILREDAAKIRNLLDIDNICSLEKFILNDEEQIQLPDDDALLPEDAGTLEKSFVAEAVEKILQTLPEDDAQIVKLYYGIDVPYSYSQPEIAVLFGVSSSAIHQRINKILEKLSTNRRLKELHLVDVEA